MVKYDIASAKIAVKSSNIRTCEEFSTILRALNVMQNLDSMKEEIDHLKQSMANEPKFVSALLTVEHMIAELEAKSAQNCF